MAAYYSATGSSDTIWYSWTASSATTCTAGSGDVWYSWYTNTATVTTSSDTMYSAWRTWALVPSASRAEAEEEAQARRVTEEQERVARAELQKREAEEKQAAEVKACELLKDIIGEEQFAIYQETGRVLVKGRNHDYMLQKDGKVTKIEKEKMVDLCIHLKDKWEMPQTDNVIALLLKAKADDYAFDHMANVVRSRDLEDLPLAAVV